MAKKIEEQEFEAPITTKEFLKDKVGQTYPADGSGDVCGEVVKDMKYMKKGHKQHFSPVIFAKLKEGGFVKEVK